VTSSDAVDETQVITTGAAQELVPKATEEPSTAETLAEEPLTADPLAEEPPSEEPPAEDSDAGAPTPDELAPSMADLSAPDPMSQLLFVDVALVLPSTHPVVVLQEAEWPYRELRIPVGGAEGVAISYAARRLATPRPLTHEMISNLLDTFELTLDQVRLTSIAGANFVAELVVSGRLGVRTIDCRPSDAIAIALRRSIPVPIMASPDVLDMAAGAAASGN
jgi:bifunctional DNase/RNase